MHLQNRYPKIIFFLLIGSWIHQWASLSTFITIDFSNFNFDWILKNRNLLILVLPLNLIFFFSLKKKTDINLIIFFFLLIAYSIGTINYQLNLPSLDANELATLEYYKIFKDIYRSKSILQITFLLNIFLAILVVNNISVMGKVDYLKILIAINLIILFIIVFLVYFQRGSLSTNPSYTLSIFGSNRYITSNGISRTLMIIFIFVFSKAIFSETKLRYFLFLICMIASYLIISNEGRLNFICLIIAIFLILFLSKFKIKKTFSILTFVLLIPLFFTILMKGVLGNLIHQHNKDKELLYSSPIILMDKIKENLKPNEEKVLVIENIEKTIDQLNLIIDKETSSVSDEEKIIVIESIKKKLNKLNLIIDKETGSVSDEEKVLVIESIKKKFDQLNLIIDKETDPSSNFNVQTIFSDIKKNRLFGFQGELRGQSLKKRSITGLNFNRILNDDCADVYGGSGTFIKMLNIISTGRVKKWQCALFIIIDNKSYLGKGPEYDRVALNVANIVKDITVIVKRVPQFKTKVLAQGEDVANGAIYAILCGGLLAFICYILIILRFVNLFLKFMINKEKKNLIKDHFFLGSIITVGYLIGRSFMENGFSAYGIDLLVLIPCYVYVFDKFNSSKNIRQKP